MLQGMQMPVFRTHPAGCLGKWGLDLFEITFPILFSQLELYT